MGLVTNILAQMLQEQNPDQEIKLLNTGARRIKSAAQCKYDDVRSVERNYTRGVHKANRKAEEWKGKVLSEDERECSYCKHYQSLQNCQIWCNILQRGITARKRPCKHFIEYWRDNEDER